MKEKPQFFLLLLLVSFASVGAVLFTPALPEISRYFGLTVGEAQLTMTSYLVGYALGQLPYGPLANRYGRKKTLFIGITLAIVGSVLCAFSYPTSSFALLIIARFVQAFGASVGLKICFTMIADVYAQTEATKMISKILIAFAIMPGLAVAVGGWLTQWLDWPSCFYFLALFGATVLGLARRLPETAPSLDLNALNLSSIIQGYAVNFKNKRLIYSGLMMGCGTSVIYVFAAKAPFIGINLIGMTPDRFGNFNLIPLVGMLSGSFLAMRLAGKYSVIRLLGVGIVASLGATFLMVVPFGMGVLTGWTLFLPMLFIYLAESLVFANSSSFGLANAQNKSNGSAVLNFINMGTAVVAVLLAEVIYPESALILPLSFVLFFCLMLLIWNGLRKSL